MVGLLPELSHLDLTILFVSRFSLLDCLMYHPTEEGLRNRPIVVPDISESVDPIIEPNNFHCDLVTFHFQSAVPDKNDDLTSSLTVV